jgi:hypothetical protein
MEGKARVLLDSALITLLLNSVNALAHRALADED